MVAPYTYAGFVSGAIACHTPPTGTYVAWPPASYDSIVLDDRYPDIPSVHRV